MLTGDEERLSLKFELSISGQPVSFHLCHGLGSGIGKIADRTVVMLTTIETHLGDSKTLQRCGAFIARLHPCREIEP